MQSNSKVDATQTRKACQGMIDGLGDRAIIRDQQSPRWNQEPLGTIAFMSQRCLLSVVEKIPTERYILDDMESAFWVMFIEYLKIAQDEDQLAYLWPIPKHFLSKKPAVVMHAKGGVGVLCPQERRLFYLGPFKDFLQCFWTCSVTGVSVAEIVERFWEIIPDELEKDHPGWGSWKEFFDLVGVGYSLELRPLY
ncbi:hypothetical protein BDN72DRAFT_836322 [Pluteus cervinus]|uniref:Uncharacterized protein n=1 Tax=Pluteus cervinus TaxID=181527 RepID=A0ACD3B5Y4_9AGAR|nr:hypothetical protein BDN72DRAFT_836322 [Pluteus cervinus]